MNEMLKSSNEDRVSDDVLIGDIVAIEEGSMAVLTRENLSQIVEAPLLDACMELYDKNIETVMSGANSKNVNGEGHIMIASDSLSIENKEIALRLGRPFLLNGRTNCIILSFPINAHTTVGDIRRDAHAMVSQFHKQDLLWGRETLENLASAYGIPSSELTPESFPDKYFDPKSGYLYNSEELYRKANGLI